MSGIIGAACAIALISTAACSSLPQGSAAAATANIGGAAPVFAPTGGAANRAYSPFVKANGFIYLAGQIGTDSAGRLVPGGIAAETRAAMTNIKRILEQNGSSMDKVVKCLVLLADVNERQAMSEVYMTFFAPDKRPARTAAGVGGLPSNARVEIDCEAVQ